MFGPGNLVEVSDKFLGDTISAARLNRSVSVIVDLLMQCRRVGSTTQDAGVVDSCANALVDCWIKPIVQNGAFKNVGAFTKVSPSSPQSEASSAFKKIQHNNFSEQHPSLLEEQHIERLTHLCPEWFASILTKARNKTVSCSELGSLAVRYISNIIDSDKRNKSASSSNSNNSNSGFALYDAPSNNTNTSASQEKDLDTSEAEVARITSEAVAAGDISEGLMSIRYYHYTNNQTFM